MSSIKIRKIGKFYNAFDNDALILHYLFNYKVNNGRVGFPENSFNKVINTLEDKNINYEVIGEKVENISNKINNIQDDKVIDILNSISELISNE